AKQFLDLAKVCVVPPHALSGLLALRLAFQQLNFVAIAAQQAAQRFEVGIELSGLAVAIAEQRSASRVFEFADFQTSFGVLSAGLFKPAGGGLSATHKLSP